MHGNIHKISIKLHLLYRNMHSILAMMMTHSALVIAPL